MTDDTSPLKTADTSLGAVRAALAPYGERALALAYPDGREVRAGYHVTEVKAGTFVTLDCGGNPDSWRETVLQVADLPARRGAEGMRVGKFLSILAKVENHVPLDAHGRITIEVSRSDEAMAVYDVAGVAIGDDEAMLRLAARSAVCKPRHRADLSAPTTCCGSATAPRSAGCCV